MELNEVQKEATSALFGRIRVTAGAGTGKTRVLVNRYVYLLNTIGVDPANILCLTFTNKAAFEMRNRIQKMLPNGMVNDFICTIHAFCAKFLREEIFRVGWAQNFQILDEEDQKSLTKRAMELCGIDRSESNVKKQITEIKRHKGRSKSAYIPDLISENTKSNEFIDKYLELQRKIHYLDFQDLIYLTTYILEESENARENWQNSLNFVMVDEAQDLSDADWHLVELISGKHNNLFIVGDPDQAIYEWRGASPIMFVNFKSDNDFILNQNYRSTPKILDIANSIICNNETRIKKDLFSLKNFGDLPIYYHAKDDKDESIWIAKQIKKIISRHYEYSDVAILFRASYISREIEHALIKEHIPYQIWGGVRFYDRQEIKDALAYLKVIVFNDDISLKRIINKPSRKFGNVSMQKLETLANSSNLSYYETLKKHLDDFKNDKIKTFISLIEECKDYINLFSISELSEYVLVQSGLKELYKDDVETERLENLAELMFSIKQYEKDNIEDDISIETYLQNIALLTNLDVNNSSKSSVKLMTIHQSKGLEFPFVFICALTEGIIPNHRAIRERKKNALEEERRLMYVASTRAKLQLFLSESEGYSHETKSEKCPSRFLKEIKSNLYCPEGKHNTFLWNKTDDLITNLNAEMTPFISKFKVGDNVYHKILGNGIIEKSNEKGSYIVKFQQGTLNIFESALEFIKI